MTQETRSSLVAAVVSALTLIGATSGAADRRPPTLVIHIADRAHVGGMGLARAKAHTERIFAAVGVRVEWADANARAREASNLYVALVSAGELAARGIREGILGCAFRADGLAFISPRRVQQLAEKKNINESLLLGRAIAHGLGHLLLPGPGHSRTGIMTLGINTGPKGVEARFTHRQTQAIRALLESRAEGVDEGAGFGK